MRDNSNSTTVELAVHKNIIDYFHAQPLFETQIISSSIIPEYYILTLEGVDYRTVVPIVQQFLPFIKVLMPIELDLQVREHLKDYDRQDLSKYTKTN